MTRVLLSAAFVAMCIASLSCATWVGANVENQRPFQDGVSEGTTQIASDTNISVIPPEPELGEPAAEEPVAEIQRLRRLIGESARKIEASRSEALRRVQKTYQANLAAIQPKDMFETEAEYWARDARQKSEVEVEKAKATNDLHRRHDALLSKEVEPLFERVRTLLGRTGILQKEAIRFNLEKYDPELGVFHGSFELDSDLMKITARIVLPMKREKARVLWKNRSALQGRVRMSVNVHSLDIELEEFWLEDSESGSRTEERIAVVEVLRPSEEERKTAKEFKASASALVERASKGAIDHRFGETAKVKGWIAEYNRLVGEVQAVFGEDPHVQALKELAYMGSNPQAAGAVNTAASGLAVYLASFVPNDAFKASASALVERASKGARNDRPEETRKVKGWIAEYNRLVGEVQAVFDKDPHVQALKELAYMGSNPQAAGAVNTAASGSCRLSGVVRAERCLQGVSIGVGGTGFERGHRSPLRRNRESKGLDCGVQSAGGRSAGGVWRRPACSSTERACLHGQQSASSRCRQHCGLGSCRLSGIVRAERCVQSVGVGVGGAGLEGGQK